MAEQQQQGKANYVGAAWIKTSKKGAGDKYLSAVVNKAGLAIFKSKSKNKPNSPDYNIITTNDLGIEMARFAEMRSEGMLPPLADIIKKISADFGAPAPETPADDDLPF